MAVSPVAGSGLTYDKLTGHGESMANKQDPSALRVFQELVGRIRKVLKVEIAGATRMNQQAIRIPSFLHGYSFRCYLVFPKPATPS